MNFVNDLEKRRTIDPETGSYLVCEGGTPEPDVQRFNFYFDGESTGTFYVQENLTSNNGEKPSVEWVFSRFNLPERLEQKRSQIAEMIRKALEAYGSHYGFETIKSATAHYNPELRG